MGVFWCQSTPSRRKKRGRHMLDWGIVARLSLIHWPRVPWLGNDCASNSSDLPDDTMGEMMCFSVSPSAKTRCLERLNLRGEMIKKRKALTRIMMSTDVDRGQIKKTRQTRGFGTRRRLSSHITKYKSCLQRRQVQLHIYPHPKMCVSR